jgi:hypothetical protein
MRFRNLCSKSFFLFMLLALLYPCGLAKAETDSVNLTTSVIESLQMSISTSSYTFGNLTPGTPLYGSGGIDVDITTSAPDGYNLGVSDGVAGTDSALLHTDISTRIPDASALISAPALWVGGTTKGLGVTVFYANTSKEGKWGAGTTYNDSNNKYAGVPETATTIHSSPSYKEGVDRTSISFILDVSNSQKTGAYAGDVTLTATAILI